MRRQIEQINFSFVPSSIYFVLNYIKLHIVEYLHISHIVKYLQLILSQFNLNMMFMFILVFKMLSIL